MPLTHMDIKSEDDYREFFRQFNFIANISYCKITLIIVKYLVFK